jgi:hypothetical protein
MRLFVSLSSNAPAPVVIAPPPKPAATAREKRASNSKLD